MPKKHIISSPADKKREDLLKRFTPLNTILKERSKNKRFRKVFTEETNRLQLIHEIKTLRQQKKMTQKQVAAKAHMPQSVVARLESGSHSFSIATLQRIAGVFNKKIALVENLQSRR